MGDKYERLLTSLSQSESWVSAAELAARLGVTTRSVRGYVAAAKTAARPLEIIESSTSGYRLNSRAFAEFTARSRDSGHGTSPADRSAHIARRLLETTGGLDVHALADGLHVSESTIEADLRRVRSLASEVGLATERSGSIVTLSGAERDRRRLLGRLFREEGAGSFLRLDTVQRQFPTLDLASFKTDLLAALEDAGYLVNQYGVDGVVLHVAIAVDRVRSGRAVDDEAGAWSELPDAEPLPRSLDALVRRHFGVALDAADLGYLARLLTARVATHDADGVDGPQGDTEAANLALVRRIAARVREEYLLELDDEAFLARFALHVGNMISRAEQRSFNRNPMGRTIKASYPTVYDIAVFIASALQRERGVEVNDDEISYLALHVGSQLERSATRQEQVRCVLVCPGYHDLPTVLRERLEAELGDELAIELVITRTDVAWDELGADLVLSTLPPPDGRGGAVLLIQPFLTEADADRVRRAVARIRRQRRRSRLKDDLLLYFSEDLFLRNVATFGQEAMIRMLGERMVALGIIDPDYIEGAIERERMSSTAFTDLLAMPHAMTMSAVRTSIAVAVNETAVPWGESRVHVVAFIAFSESDRASFQTVFDQFVEVFADGAGVLELIKQADDFASFIELLVRLIDA